MVVPGWCIFSLNWRAADFGCEFAEILMPLRLIIRFLIAFSLTNIALSLTSPVAAALPPLVVSGNRLQTADGRPVRLQGVNIPSLEWGQGEHVFASLMVAVNDWKANLVRLPLCQDRWFGKTKEQSDGGAAYRKTVYEFVQTAASLNCYVVLDLHWSDANVWGLYVGQHKMPDDTSVDFWNAVAPMFANHPAVLFGLYNEPNRVSWSTWRNGGPVSEENEQAPGGKLSYHTPGLQKLLEVCRAKGARNVVVAGGLDWAFDLTGIAAGFALTETNGNGIVYDAHLYPWKTWYTHGKEKTQDLDRFVMSAGRKHPVLIGEFGDDKGDYPQSVIEFAKQNHLAWTAWCLHPNAKPNLIRDWNYTPTAFGEVVKKALTKAAAQP
jgi:endoglucanase